jgi:hypothetical protein
MLPFGFPAGSIFVYPLLDIEEMQPYRFIRVILNLLSTKFSVFVDEGL